MEDSPRSGGGDRDEEEEKQGRAREQGFIRDLGWSLRTRSMASGFEVSSIHGNGTKVEENISCVRFRSIV